MSAAVVAPASLGPWSASQKKAASRIFAKALLSALPNASINKDSGWTSDKKARQTPVKLPPKKEDCNNNSYETDNDDDYSDEASEHSYSEDSSTYFGEVCVINCLFLMLVNTFLCCFIAYESSSLPYFIHVKP